MAWNHQPQFRGNTPTGGGGGGGSTSSSRCELSRLTCGQTGASVAGLVVAKETPRLRQVKSNPSGGEPERHQSRSVFTFTLRDSLHDLVNVSCWGGAESGFKLAASFHIGDVVLVTNATVQSKQEGSYADRCLVQTPSRVALSINDRYSTIERYTGRERDFYASLQSALTFPPSEHVTIGQIVQYAHTRLAAAANQSQPATSSATQHQSQQPVRPPAEHLTFFAAVKEIGEPRDLLSSAASTAPRRVLRRCEVVLFDETCASFPLVLWDDEWIRQATSMWIAKGTTLSVVDCRIKYDNFRRGVIGSADSRTVIIVNPDTPETLRLHQYAQAEAMVHPSPSVARSLQKQDEMPLTSIHTVVTVRGIKARQAESGYGIVFAMLTRLSIDADDVSSFTVIGCSNCHRRLHATQRICTTVDCPMVGRDVSEGDQAYAAIGRLHELDYNTVVHLSDHTGTLSRCLLGGNVMEQLLGHSVHELVAMTVQDRARLKWHVFMRRYKVYFHTNLPTFDKPDPYTTILACHEPNFYEVMTSLRA